jgi:hypothetical protein
LENITGKRFSASKIFEQWSKRGLRAADFTSSGGRAVAGTTLAIPEHMALSSPQAQFINGTEGKVKEMAKKAAATIVVSAQLYVRYYQADENRQQIEQAERPKHTSWNPERRPFFLSNG